MKFRIAPRTAVPSSTIRSQGLLALVIIGDKLLLLLAKNNTEMRTFPCRQAHVRVCRKGPSNSPSGSVLSLAVPKKDGCVPALLLKLNDVRLVVDSHTGEVAQKVLAKQAVDGGHVPFR